MKIEIAPNKNLASIKVAELIHEQILKKPDSTIGLATGNTMISVYEAFKVILKDSGTDLSKVKFTMLDEYWDLDIDHPASFKTYLLNALDGLNLNISQFYFHKTELPADEATKYYDDKIRELGGIDLQLLGIGMNGHIAFNEPGTPFSETTHVIKLTESTIKANQKDFKGAFPTMAITMGIENIMEARKVVMIVLGESKSEIIFKSLEGEVTQECPASVLQNHPQLEVILDFEASQKMREQSSSALST